MKILSHRGYWKNKQEKNSIAAFDRSFLNSYGLETDLRDVAGGGYCKGNNAITFTQCQDCGYIYNSTFDLNKISKEYQSEGYFSRKIVSKAMSNNINK